MLSKEFPSPCSLSENECTPHLVPTGTPVKVARKCLGRVTDLESNVTDSWWKTVFSDDFYLKTDGDVVEDPQITCEEIKALKGLSENTRMLLSGFRHSPDSCPKKPVRILDLCSGQGRHLLRLAADTVCSPSSTIENFYFAGLELYGHDQSEFLIDLAKSRAKSLGLSDKIQFTVGDCRSIPYPDQYFDIVMILGNSFGYFKRKEDHVNALLEIHRVLESKNGSLILDLTDGAFMRGNFSPRSWEWLDDPKYFVARERELSKDGSRLISREVITDIGEGVVRDQFYEEWLFDEDQIWKLLNECKFYKNPQTAVSTAALFSGELSQRGQDLGMMECRLLVSATKTFSNPLDKKNSYNELKLMHSFMQEPQPELSDLFDGLTVIMGDPTLPCKGKLHDIWNSEDFHTINRLKTALETLSIPKISILNNHLTLTENLIRLKKQEMFLNLCDEGYMNDANQEIHIPVLLNMLGLSNYSGCSYKPLVLCFDKQITNNIARSYGIAIPKETFFNFDPIKCNQHPAVEFPLFVKPARGDNSLGITQTSLVSNQAELLEHISNVYSTYGIQDFLLQEYLEGDEYSIGIIGNPSESCSSEKNNDFYTFKDGILFLSVLKVDYSRIKQKGLVPILGYESKWDPSSPYWTDIDYLPVHENLNSSSNVVNKLRESALKLFKIFDLKDYARFDFRCTSTGELKLLEINPNPGWCWDGKLAKMVHHMLDFQQLSTEYSYEFFIELLLRAFHSRIQRASKC